MGTNTGESLTTDIRFSIVPEWVLDAKISDRALRVYAVLARYADNDTLQAFPGRATIAERVRCSVKSVDRALEELISVGAIEKEHRVKDGVYQSSLFTVIRVGVGTAVTPGVGTRVTLGGDTGDARVGTRVTNRTITSELEPENYINEFNEFWNIYPKKADKRVAFRAFVKALKRVDLDVVMAGAGAYRDDPNRKPEFTKNPATWLNADAWENEALASPAAVNEWGKPLGKPAELPEARAWVKAMHNIGEHWECRPGEFGCKP